MTQPYLTIFTPTYNRAYRIKALYDSLCQQTCKDFEWLVVDDGSTDNTKELITSFINENMISIRYVYQENGGKHRAINRGAQDAAGKMFFIVDSDDYVTSDAVQWILDTSNTLINNQEYAGISGLRIHPDGSKIGGENNFSQIDTDAISIRSVYHVTGDLAEVYKTSVIKAYPFPDCPGERFCSEGLIWNRIARAGYKLQYHYKGIYVGEYLTDGLTTNRNKCREESPNYSMLLYSELIRNPKTDLVLRIKYALLFWRYSKKSKMSLYNKSKMLGHQWSWVIPGAIIMRILNK